MKKKVGGGSKVCNFLHGHVFIEVSDTDRFDRNEGKKNIYLLVLVVFLFRH